MLTKDHRLPVQALENLLQDTVPVLRTILSGAFHFSDVCCGQSETGQDAEHDKHDNLVVLFLHRVYPDERQRHVQIFRRSVE